MLSRTHASCAASISSFVYGIFMPKICAERNRRSVWSRRRKIAGPVGGLVGAHALEHAHAVVQRVRQHVRRGVAPRHHLAVVPDPSVAVGHRHGADLPASENDDFSRFRPASAGVHGAARRRGAHQRPPLRPNHATARRTRAPQRGTAARSRLRRRLDARVRRAGQPDLVLQPAVVAIGVGGRGGDGAGTRPSSPAMPSSAMLPALRVSAAMLVRVREHEVLDRELDVDHAAGVVLEVEQRGPVRMAGEHPAAHVDDVGARAVADRAAGTGSPRARPRTPRRSRRRRRRTARGSAPGAPRSTPARARSGGSRRATTTSRPVGAVGPQAQVDVVELARRRSCW